MLAVSSAFHYQRLCSLSQSYRALILQRSLEMRALNLNVALVEDLLGPAVPL